MDYRIIGVDPAKRDYGCAIATITGDTLLLHSFKKPHQFVWNLLDLEGRDDILFAIEDSNAQSAVFNPYTEKYSGKSVGKNMGVTSLIIEACRESVGFNNVYLFSPREKGRKWSEKEFKYIFKDYNIEVTSRQRITQDKIDAAKVAYLLMNKLRNGY